MGMNLWEYLDRRGERRAQHVRKPLDVRVLIGALFFAGYYFLVYRLLSTQAIASENAPLVRDAMLVLGPPVGAIVNALFRTDARDEQATLNTGEAFRAQRAQAEATVAAAATTPAPTDAMAGAAADAVADAAADRAADFTDTDLGRNRDA